jgi:hypothetical protein
MLAEIQSAVSIGCVVIAVASGICALTPTPAPDTAWGCAYRAIEIAALLVGKAKDRGLVAPNAAAEAIGADVLDVAKAVIVKQ